MTVDLDEIKKAVNCGKAIYDNKTYNVFSVKIDENWIRIDAINNIERLSCKVYGRKEETDKPDSFYIEPDTFLKFINNVIDADDNTNEISITFAGEKLNVNCGSNTFKSPVKLLNYGDVMNFNSESCRKYTFSKKDFLLLCSKIAKFANYDENMNHSFLSVYFQNTGDSVNIYASDGRVVACSASIYSYPESLKEHNFSIPAVFLKKLLPLINSMGDDFNEWYDDEFRIKLTDNDDDATIMMYENEKHIFVRIFNYDFMCQKIDAPAPGFDGLFSKNIAAKSKAPYFVSFDTKKLKYYLNKISSVTSDIITILKDKTAVYFCDEIDNLRVQCYGAGLTETAQTWDKRFDSKKLKLALSVIDTEYVNMYTHPDSELTHNFLFETYLSDDQSHNKPFIFMISPCAKAN